MQDNFENVSRNEPFYGLSEEEAADRTAAGLVNFDADAGKKTTVDIVRENVCTLFNLVNLVLAVAVGAVGSFKNMLFMGVVFCNLIIGIVQELRAKKTVEKLTLMAQSKVTVVRGGKRAAIFRQQVVLGDVLHYASGAQIAADGMILSGECEIDESFVTGEAEPVVKKTGDSILAGSFVVSGSVYGSAEKIGADNYVAQIALGAKYHKKSYSEIMSTLNKIIRAVSIAIVPIGIILFLRQLNVDGATAPQAVVSSVAALIGMIPEGLMLLTSTVLAVGVIRLSKRRVLVQDLYSIESLARVDTLCLDKTGTITEGKMEVSDIISLNGFDETKVLEHITALAANLQDENSTFLAIKARFNGESSLECKKCIPFSSKYKWSGAVFEGFSLVMGAAEFIMSSLPPDLAALLLEYSKQGRVLLLASCCENILPSAPIFGAKPEALIVLRDKIRDSAMATLEYFKKQGVDLRVISGDSAETVKNIARRAGLDGWELAVDASALSAGDIDEAVEKYKVFGRVTPMQKRELVTALKRKGHTVAMTGDGINDVLALKEADCSIAMASGTDAARNVSKLVLLDSDFDSMPSVVVEGRRAINNIQRSASFFLVKTIYSAVLAVFFMFLPFTYPFMPIQLTLISVVSIGIPSFVLALEPNHERISGAFLPNILKKALPGALTIIINLCLILIYSSASSLTYEASSTLCVVVTGIAGLIMVFRISYPFNALRTLLFIFLCTLFAFCAIFLRSLFSLTFIAETSLAIPVFALTALMIFSVMLFIFSRIFAKH